MTSKQAEELARSILFEYWGVSKETHLPENLTRILAEAIVKAHAAGRNEALEERETPAEYVRGYEQGVRVGRAELLAQVLPSDEEMQKIIRDSEMSPYGVYLYLKSL